MEYIRLGDSTLQVSRVCLSSSDFGMSTERTLLSQEETDEIVKKALVNGINFFETANYYNNGTGQEYLGNALRKYAKREQIKIALKLFDEKMGLSRKALFHGVEESLGKLHTDYIDLLILPKWDYQTPIEETMEALNDMVKVGRIHQIGASDMYAYQFIKAQETARIHHWKRFVSMQSNYHVLYREDERELMRVLQEEKVSMTPCVSSVIEKITAFEKILDSEGDEMIEQKKNEDYPILVRMNELAKQHNSTMLQIALAWFYAKEGVAVPVIGIKNTEELDEVVASVAIKLSPEEMQYLEEPYVPHKMLEVV